MRRLEEGSLLIEIDEEHRFLNRNKTIGWILAIFIGPSLIILSILGFYHMDNIITSIALIIISIIYTIGSSIICWNKFHGIVQILPNIYSGLIISLPAIFFILNGKNDIVDVYIIPLMAGILYFIMGMIIVYKD